MSLTRLALEKNRITLTALLIILISGILSYLEMPRDEDPGFLIRVAQVTTIFPGASPERVEQLVTDKLEKAIQEIPEIDFISSTSKVGLSSIAVNIREEYTDLRPIWDNLRRKVERAQTALPEGIQGPFVDDEFGDLYGIVFAITGPDFNYAELKEIADECRDELLLDTNIAKVDLHGVQEERIFVEFNNARLAELGLSPGQLQSILTDRNIIISGGEVFTADEQIVLEPTGNFDSVQDLRKTVIRLPETGQLVYLQDLVDITRGYVDPAQSLMTYNGLPAIGVAVNMKEGGNIVDMGESVKQYLERFRSNYPIGIDFDLVAYQTEHVQKKVEEFEGNLFQAIAIVLLVMLLFLGLRTGLVVASLIPMAMIMAFWVMSWFGIGLDQMSLASLIIALGMLVDNAIVMSESIMVQMGRGVPARNAAIDSARELQIPLLTSSLTTAAAFLPIYLAESAVGEYCAPLFKVVSITLLCSWLLALTLIPILCATFLRVKRKEETGFNTPLYRIYRTGLLKAVRHPFLSVTLVVILFAGGIKAFGYVPQLFFPENEKPIMTAELRMPVGTPLARTQAIVHDIEEFMKNELMVDIEKSREGILNWSSFIGAGAPRYNLGYGPEPTSPEYAYMLINTSNYEEMKNHLIPELKRYCNENFPDLLASVSGLFYGPPVDWPIEVRVSGRDTDTLFDLVETIKVQLQEMPGITNIRDNWGQRSKKLLVKVDQPRALRAGLTSRDVAVSLQTILSGLQTTDYREGDEIIPVTLRSSAADRQDIGKLESHNIFVQSTGESVPLKQVADLEVAWEPAKVLRRDRLRTVTIQAGIGTGQNAIALTQQLDQWLQPRAAAWPIGYKYELGGEIESSGESNQSINEKLPIAGLIILLLLVVQFNSFRKPLIIFLTIPLGIIGVAVGLLVARSYFGFMTLLGIISLSGIVINNAIVLLDRIQIEMDENGRDPAHAVIESAQQRLRPILLTTATTIGGLIPLWLGGGLMWEPMAIAIIFGLLFATLMTLGVVPVLYSLFYRVSYKDVSG